MPKGCGGGRSPNDQRSDVKNPNNREHDLDRQNRDKQARESEEDDEDE